MSQTIESAGLKQLWTVQLEILDIIDGICRKNDIHYSLYAGSLLGAVRHHGYIPWDDDLDVCMSREYYERFIEVWNQEEYPGYILQNKDNTPTFTQSFTKIRKDHTTFLQFDWEKNRYHTGIFVDIFPIDRIPDGNISRKKFYWDCMRYQLYMREFVPPKGNAVVKAVSNAFLKGTSSDHKTAYRKQFDAKLREYNKHKKWNTVSVETLKMVRMVMPADLLDQYIRLEFADKEYECFEKWDECLTCQYGDYMQLPPESERIWNHQHLLIDFEHNYEELSHE